MVRVTIIMGSDSDLPVLQKGTAILTDFGVDYDLRILSAHRTPAAVTEYVAGLEKAGCQVVIAAAGKAAHLPGVVAAHTTLPVIGLPIRATLDGMDALLSIVQMPGGVPVATVGINAADNAALLALEILAINDASVKAKLVKYRATMSKRVLEKDRKVRKGRS